MTAGPGPPPSLALPGSALADSRLTSQRVSLNLRLVSTYDSALNALGDPTRRLVFERVAGRPRSVGEIARELPVSRPAVSQHLRVLKEAGLVVDHCEGTRHIYAVVPEGVAEIRAYFDSFWTQALANFKAVAEMEGEEQ